MGQKMGLDGIGQGFTNVPIVEIGGFMKGRNGEQPAISGRIFELALEAHRTGESLDQLAAEELAAARSRSATSSRNVSQRPSIKKSRVTLNLSTSK